jgi:site-specific recombinase XerD
MESRSLRVVTDGSVGDLPAQIRSFERHLRLKNLAPNTIGTYVKHARWFARWTIEAHRGCPCAAADHTGGPVDVADLTRERVEDYILHLQATVAASTVGCRFRSLQQFFRYLAEEDEIEVSPLAKMDRPKVPEIPVPVVSDEDLQVLLKSVAGKGFEDRRDNAVLRLFLDCGIRLDELGRLAVESLDFSVDQIEVWGKGRRPRIVPFDERTGQALERYLRERARHPWAGKVFTGGDPDDPREGNHPLWLGARGWLGPSGVYQLLKRRSRAALGEHVHPHQLRHTAAHHAAAAGMSETDMMRIFGWKSSEMPKRYGSSAADERARATKRRIGLGNRF